jgi:phage terminase small subunit
MWDDLVPRLTKIGIIKPEDAYALACLCLAWERLLTATTNSEHWAASREIRAWAPHFGLTPSSEQGLGGDSADPNDPFSLSLPDAM